MNIKALSINLNESQDLMCAIIVRRLRDLRWPADEVSRIADKAIDIIDEKVKDESVLSRLAHDAAMMHASGASKGMVQQMANALYAVIAVKIADDLNRSRVAECN
jgi:hypothetical protein